MFTYLCVYVFMYLCDTFANISRDIRKMLVSNYEYELNIISRIYNISCFYISPNSTSQLLPPTELYEYHCPPLYIISPPIAV